MPLALPRTAGRALFTAEDWAEIHDKNGNRISPQGFYYQVDYEKVYKARYDHGVSIKVPQMPASGSCGSTNDEATERIIERDLTSKYLRELFGEDEKGHLLPDAELNALLGPAYADIFAKKKADMKPAAPKAAKSRTSSAQALKANQRTTAASSVSKKSAQRAQTPIHANNKKTQKPLPPSKLSQVATPDTVDSVAPTEPLKSNPVWSSALALCQQIEVYKGVKVKEYCGYNGISQVVSEIEMEDETVRLRVLRHADGWLELIVSGLLGDGRAEMGKTMHDVRDTSVLELSRRVQFREDVGIEEYDDEDALDAIGAASAEFDRERIMATLYRHPGGLVEYVVSGPVVQAGVATQAGVDTAEADTECPNDATNSITKNEDRSKVHEQKRETQSTPSSADENQKLAKKDDKEEPRSELPDATPNIITAPAPKTGKRKRPADDSGNAADEVAAWQTKRTRTDEDYHDDHATVKSLTVVVKVASHKLASITPSKAATVVLAEQADQAVNRERSSSENHALTDKKYGDQKEEHKILGAKPLGATSPKSQPYSVTPSAPKPAAAAKRKRDVVANALEADTSGQPNEQFGSGREQNDGGRLTAGKRTQNAAPFTSAPTAKETAYKAAAKPSKAEKNSDSNAARKHNMTKKTTVQTQTAEVVAQKQIDGGNADEQHQDVSDKSNTATTTPEAKRKRAGRDDEDDSDPDDELPLAKRARVHAAALTMAEKHAPRSNVTAKRKLATGISNAEKEKAIIQGHEEISTDDKAEGKRLVEERTTASTAPVIAETSAVLGRGPSQAPTPRTTATVTNIAAETEEEATTAPMASEVEQPTTADVQIEDDAATPAGGKKSKRPVRKPTGTARNGKRYVKAGPDPDRIPGAGSKRGRDEDAEEGVSAGSKRARKF